MTDSKARIEVTTGDRIYDNAGWHNQPETAPDPIYEAANLLFRHRHNLAPDVLRTLACVWQCASAARYGEPHEEFWADQDDFYAGHDVDECEADNQAAAA